MGLFLLCQFTGIGITYWGGTGAARMSYCPVNFLLKPFAIFYLTISRGKGLFFTASNFVLVGETLLILIAFTILGAIIGITINKKK